MYHLLSLTPFQPLQIKSVVAVEGLKGYIYIEAYKQQHVKQAIEDIGNLRLGKWQQLMVPIREMTDVMRVVKDTYGVKRGSWVRIKRGIFKDDVAQVSMLCDQLYGGMRSLAFHRTTDIQVCAPSSVFNSAELQLLDLSSLIIV